MASADYKEENNATAELSVLHISDCHNEEAESTTAVQSKPKFNYDAFATILSRILIKSDPPAGTKPVEYNKKYLGVLCLKNKKAKVLMYHMFYTDEKEIGEDYQKTRLLYADQPHIRAFNSINVHTNCPESLHRSALKHFTEYKWSKDGNVLETPFCVTDTNLISKELHELDQRKDLQLFNYIQFLKMSKS